MKRHVLYSGVMTLCFIYGGISLFFFLMQIMGMNGLPSIGGPPPLVEAENASETSFIAIRSYQPGSDLSSGPVPNLSFERFARPQSRISAYFNIVIFTSLFGSVVSILAGIAVFSLLRKRERKELTRSVIDVVTTPEEKRVLKELEENGGVLTQSELARRTKLTKVRVHRVVKRLEGIGIVSKYSYGMTNKIKLEKKIYEQE